MIFRKVDHWMFSMILMTIAVVLGDLILLISPNREYYVLFSAITLLYVLPYLSVAIVGKNQPPLALCIGFFTLLKIYYIFVQTASGALSLSDGGDAISYHIPQAQTLESFDDYIVHLFNIGGVYNGRLTHVLLAIYLRVLRYFGFNSLEYENIYTVAYIFNTLICIVTILIYYQAALNLSSSINVSRRAVWFLALNPYFFGITSLPQKEPILFLALSLFVLFLSKPKRKISILVGALFIIAMERIYMIPLLVAILLMFDEKNAVASMFDKRKALPKIVLLCGAIVFFQWFIGFETAYVMLQNHVESLTEIEGSYVEGHGFISNLVRTFLGPAFFRPFLSEYIPDDMMSLSHNLLFLFYPYVAIKAALNPKGIGLAIFASYLFVFAFIPFHGSFKMLMVVSLTGLFLDKIAMVQKDGKRTSDAVIPRLRRPGMV